MQDDTNRLLQQQIQQQQQQALAQASTANLERQKDITANPQAIDQSKLIQNQQQLTRSMPGIAIKGNVELNTNFTKTETTTSYSNYQAIKDAKGNPWLVGTDAKSKDFIVSPDFKTAYKLSNPNAVEDRLKSNEAKTYHLGSDLKYEGVIGAKGNQYAEMKDKDGSKIYVGVSKDSENNGKGNIGWAYKDGEKTTHKIDNPEQKLTVTRDKLERDKAIANLKRDPQIAEALKRDEMVQKALPAFARSAAEFGTWLGTKSISNLGGALGNNEATIKNAGDTAETLAKEAVAAPNLEDKKAKEQALNDVIMLHASDPASAIAKLVSSKNSQAEEIADGIYGLGQQEVPLKKQEEYLNKMETIYNKINSSEESRNDPKNANILNYYNNYHLQFKDSGRTMNGFDAEVYRTVLRPYKK